MSKHGGVIHIGSFSKSIAPALRVGYIVAEWNQLSRMYAAEDRRRVRRARANGAGRTYCPKNFGEHVPPLTRGLRKSWKP